MGSQKPRKRESGIENILKSVNFYRSLESRSKMQEKSFIEK